MTFSLNWKMMPCLLLVVLLVLTFSEAPAFAERRYVSDLLIIVLRDNPSQNYNTVKTLKTDTPLEILEETDEFFRVKTLDGEEGWVRKQYLTAETPKKIIISRLQQQNEKLTLSLNQVKEELAAATNKLEIEKTRYATEIHNFQSSGQQNQGEISRLTKELTDLQIKHKTFLENAKDSVELLKTKDTLSKENQELTSEAVALRQENTQLKRKVAIHWFLAGGGVLLLGFIVGKIGSRKKRYY